MKLQIEQLGKVALTVGGLWDKTKDYDKLVIVSIEDGENGVKSFISKKPVSAGVSIFDRTYWLPVANDIKSISKAYLDKVFNNDIPTPDREWVIPDEIIDDSTGDEHSKSGCSCMPITEEELDENLI